MSRVLVIVESPGKVKKIRTILGDGYDVAASVGHVRDLPERDLGVGPAPAYAPTYVVTPRGKEVLAKLRAAISKAKTVLLATDPDREGEAIAWHLSAALNLKYPQRVTFNAITDAAVRAAISAPRKINLNLVRAQEARRVLDRLIGYTVSPVLSARTAEQLSAGRVQSPAVRLVVEREREIASFRAVQHFGAELIFGTGTVAWRAQWDTKPWRPAGSEYLLDRALAERVAALRRVRVTRCDQVETKTAPPPPFITSTLQQTAGSKLKLKPKATMEAAQRLYEQGLITYHRTDNPNLSDEGFHDITAYARAASLPVADARRHWKAKAGAQEAHEAIRPTHIDVETAGDSELEQRVYALIRNRALASQLADAVHAVRTLTLEALERVDGKPVTFFARGKTLKYPGWMTVQGAEASGDASGADGEESQAQNPVPHLAVHRATDPPLIADSSRLLTKTTQPPPRYKQETLIKKLEELGIGRPATYASILENITTRGYVVEDLKRFLTPGPAGVTIVDALVGVCTFVEMEYTRDLEQALDDIALGSQRFEEVVGAAHTKLMQELGGLKCAAPAARPCPACGAAMRRRTGKRGSFWGCSAYPKCTATQPDDDEQPRSKAVTSRSRSTPPSGEPGPNKAADAGPPPACPACGRALRRRPSANGKGYWWGCTGFPECKTSLRDRNGNPVMNGAKSRATARNRK